MKKYNTDKAISEVLSENGAFFAFSNAQFDEQKKEGVTYTRLSSGMICPVDNVKKLSASLNQVFSDKITWELENNAKEEIINYELANHECQITMSYADIIPIMASYGITEDDIKQCWPAYIDYCVEHDYF